jgi:hypothetical protein
MHKLKDSGIPRFFTAVDFLLIITLLAASAASIPVLQNGRPKILEIYRDNRLIATYPLSESREIEVKGPAGSMTISINQARADVTRSSCPHQICVKSSAIDKSGSQIVCAPNHILIQISSPKNGTGVDAIAR